MADNLELVWVSLKEHFGRRFGPDPVHLDEDDYIIVFKDGEGFKILGYMHYFFGKADHRHMIDLVGGMRAIADSAFGPNTLTLICNAPFSTMTPIELYGLPSDVSYQIVSFTQGDRSVEMQDVDLGEAAKEFLRRLRGSDDSRYMVLMEGNVAKVHVHNLDDGQRERIEALGDEPDVSRIREILNVDDLAKTQGDFHFTGIPTSPMDCRISVFDRAGALVWESDEGFTMDLECGQGEVRFPLRTEDVLLYREDFQGLYKAYMLDTEGEFDPVKLACKNVAVCGRCHLVDELVYGEGELYLVNDLGHQVRYWSTAAM